MTPNDLAAIGQIVAGLGVPGCLAVAVFALWKSLVVTRAHHEEVCAQLREARDFWRAQATAEREERQQASVQLATTTRSVDGLTAALADVREAMRDLGRERRG